MGHERIELGDSPQDAVVKMSDGNPGAINVMMSIILKGGAIDPKAFLGGLGVILSLDTHGIYGPDIWILFKDVCKQNIGHMLGVLRAVQLGIIPESTMKAMMNRTYAGPETPETLTEQVIERLDGQFFPDAVSV